MVTPSSRCRVWQLAEEPSAKPAAGKVLLLDNGRILEGDIDRVGDQYRIRREVGETWVSASNVLCLCSSREETYNFLRLRVNLQDVEDHYRLAQWCHRHGLREQTLLELGAALSLRPDHPASRRLLDELRRPVQPLPAPTPPPASEENEPAQKCLPLN